MERCVHACWRAFIESCSGLTLWRTQRRFRGFKTEPSSNRSIEWLYTEWFSGSCTAISEQAGLKTKVCEIFQPKQIVYPMHWFPLRVELTPSRRTLCGAWGCYRRMSPRAQTRMCPPWPRGIPVWIRLWRCTWKPAKSCYRWVAKMCYIQHLPKHG